MRALLGTRRILLLKPILNELSWRGECLQRYPPLSLVLSLTHTHTQILSHSLTHTQSLALSRTHPPLSLSSTHTHTLLLKPILNELSWRGECLKR